jgi:hypothetical protein
MNRQIKFRGKTAKGEWLYGYYLEKELCDGAGRCAYIKFDGSQEVRVLKDTVGQFTGLYDATRWEDLTEEKRDRWTIDGNMPSEWKGREIYEGDIIKAYHPNYIEKFIGSVFWDYELAAFCLRFCGTEMTLANFDEFIVIGNIHDNPELLK